MEWVCCVPAPVTPERAGEQNVISIDGNVCFSPLDRVISSGRMGNRDVGTLSSSSKPKQIFYMPVRPGLTCGESRRLRVLTPSVLDFQEIRHTLFPYTQEILPKNAEEKKHQKHE